MMLFAVWGWFLSRAFWALVSLVVRLLAVPLWSICCWISCMMDSIVGGVIVYSRGIHVSVMMPSLVMSLTFAWMLWVPVSWRVVFHWYVLDWVHGVHVSLSSRLKLNSMSFKAYVLNQKSPWYSPGFGMRSPGG